MKGGKERKYVSTLKISHGNVTGKVYIRLRLWEVFPQPAFVLVVPRPLLSCLYNHPLG